MTNKLWMLAVVAAAALGASTVAFGGGGSGGSKETALTGDTLAKVKAAAIAKVGGTVDSATTENDGSNANAAYEAHVTKADGTHVTVILDKDSNVLSVETGHGGRDGHHGGPGNGETELTGDTATKAKAAAVAKVGGTVDRASTENDGSNASAAYEVHVTKADGTHVTVILDKSFAVLSVETRGDGGPRDGVRHH